MSNRRNRSVSNNRRSCAWGIIILWFSFIFGRPFTLIGDALKRLVSDDNWFIKIMGVLRVGLMFYLAYLAGVHGPTVLAISSGWLYILAGMLVCNVIGQLVYEHTTSVSSMSAFIGSFVEAAMLGVFWGGALAFFVYYTQ